MQHAARWGSIIITAGVLSMPVHARAAEADAEHTQEGAIFGKKGTLSVVLERLAGISYHRITTPGTGSGDLLLEEKVEVSAFEPDVAFDGFLLDHLSLGVRAAYGGVTMSQAHYPYAQTLHHVDLFPRVGFAWALPSKFGVWAQASFGGSIGWYTQFSSGSSPEVSRTGSLSAGLSVLGTYTPAPHVVLTAGPWISREVYRDSTGAPWSNNGVTDSRDKMPMGLSLGAGVFL